MRTIRAVVAMTACSFGCAGLLPTAPVAAPLAPETVEECRTIDLRWRAFGITAAAAGIISALAGIGLAINSNSGNRKDIGAGVGVVALSMGLFAGISGWLNGYYAKEYVVTCTDNLGGRTTPPPGGSDQTP